MGTFETVGLLEGITSAIGEADNEIGGYRITRTSSPTSTGATTINAYSTLDWEEEGLIGIDGCVYSYTGKTLTTFTGIAHVKDGVAVVGTAKDHTEEAEIVDLSKAWSALDLLRRAILVDYAEGENLTVIGSNLGVVRLPIFKDDDRFRSMIKATAYNPKGTMWGIELALTALLGEGNYEIFEDLLQFPNTVFLTSLGEGDLSDVVQGKAYLNTIGYDEIVDRGGGIIALEAPTTNLIAIGSVRLHDLAELFDFRADKPSAVQYDYYPGVAAPGNAFTYVGTLPEGTAVTATGNYTQITSSDGSAVYYRMLDLQGARITPDTYCEISYLLSVPSGAPLGAVREQCSLAIQDGAIEVAVGVVQGGAGLLYNIGLYDAAGSGFIGSFKTLSDDGWYDIRLKKYGQDRVELWVDGLLVHSEPYSTWTTVTTQHRVEFGIRATSTAGMNLRTKQIGITLQTPTEYWNYRSNTGSVNSGAPSFFNDSVASPFVSGDTGKKIVVTGSTITNPQGGNNNGIWIIGGYISSSLVLLVSKTYEDSATLEASGRITVNQEQIFVYPDDLGKDIIISGSAAGNNGTYVITNLIEAGTLTDFADYDTPITNGLTNICEVATAFTPEADLTWKLQPNHVTESNLSWELSDAGTIAGDTMSLRQPLWVADLIMSFLFTDVLSGQLLENTRVENVLVSEGPPVVFTYWPFYLGSTLDIFLKTITAAGVIPELVID